MPRLLRGRLRCTRTLSASDTSSLGRLALRRLLLLLGHIARSLSTTGALLALRSCSLSLSAYRSQLCEARK